MKTILHVVDLSAGRSAVYEALTSEAGLAKWWTTRVALGEAKVGAVIDFTFAGDFNPDMEITELDSDTTVGWKCTAGHDPWQDSSFRFQISTLEDGRTRLRFRHDYAVELDDDYYGIYNFNWGYYLESLRSLLDEGEGKPFSAV